MTSIPIVSEQDEILYHKDSHERDLHNEIMRCSGLWILNEKGEVLIALRSKNKRSFPNIWGPSVTGSNEEGETYESNIIKEAEEELGLSIKNPIWGIKERGSESHEYFVQWFFVTIPSNTQFVLQESEVDQVRWISITDLRQWDQKNPEQFVPLFNTDIDVVENYVNQN